MTPLSRDKKGTRAKRSAGRSNAWVTQTLKKMSLREKLGQMLMMSYFGAFTPSRAQNTRRCCTKSRKITSAA